MKNFFSLFILIAFMSISIPVNASGFSLSNNGLDLGFLSYDIEQFSSNSSELILSLGDKDISSNLAQSMDSSDKSYDSGVSTYLWVSLGLSAILVASVVFM